MRIGQVRYVQTPMRIMKTRRPCGGIPMRDWLLVLAPVVAVGYFVVHPDQFTIVMDWAVGMLR